MKIIWLSAINCNGNIHSFLNYEDLQQFCNDFELLYHPVLESKHRLQDLVQKKLECDILLIDGALSDNFLRYEVKIKELVAYYGKKARYIFTVGTCATFGGIFQKSYEDGSGLHYRGEKLLSEFESFRGKTISLPGCPLQPEVLVNTLYKIKYKFALRLDSYLRPKEFYTYSVHNGCTQNEYFEYKIDSHTLGKKAGCTFYNYGCQGPFTKASCNAVLWNTVNSKTRAGAPCIGCSEPTFPKENLFETKKSMGVPKFLPFGVPKRAYLAIAGVSKSFTIARLEREFFDD